MEAIKINHLPSLTWNKLKMNEGEIKENIDCNTAVETVFETLPAGLRSENIRYSEGEAWIRDHAPEQTTERFVAAKKPVYHPQKFGTGAGAEFDALLEREDVRTTLVVAEKDAKIKEPVLWNTLFRDGNRAVDAQIIHLKENAEVTVVMSWESSRQAQGFAGVSTKIILEKGAKLHLTRIQLLGEKYIHVDDLGASLAEDAQMTLVQLELGSAQSFAGAEIDLIGRKSAFKAVNGYLGVGSQQTDINYNVIQRGKKTATDMTFSGVLRDQAQKIFRGTIDFRNGSAGSVGHEQENVLLLSPDISNRSIPVILCEEEDVEGSHGATIGRLAEDMLFYLETRGIDQKAAEEMMVRANLGAVAREIPDEALQKKVMTYIEEAFS